MVCKIKITEEKRREKNYTNEKKEAQISFTLVCAAKIVLPFWVWNFPVIVVVAAASAGHVDALCQWMDSYSMCLPVPVLMWPKNIQQTCKQHEKRQGKRNRHQDSSTLHVQKEKKEKKERKRSSARSSGSRTNKKRNDNEKQTLKIGFFICIGKSNQANVKTSDQTTHAQHKAAASRPEGLPGSPI